MSKAEDFQPEKNKKSSGGWLKFLTWMKISGNYVGEHAPEFVKQTRDRGWLVYVRGSQALATNALSASGVDVKSAVIAGSLTLALYLVLNSILLMWLSSSYESYIPAFLAEVKDRNAAVIRMKEKKWIAQNADAKAGASILQGLKDEELKEPLHHWIETAFLNPGMDEVESKLARALKELATGSPKGWIYLQTHITSGAEVYRQLLDLSGGNMSIVEGDEGRKKACIAMIDDLVGAMQRPVRWQLRINGVIQMATVFVGLLVLTAVTRRYLFVTRLAGNWLFPDIEKTLLQSGNHRGDNELRAVVERLRSSSDVDADNLIRTEVDRLSRDTSTEIYELYWFLAGIMPSLGFIGTVVGMSASLMMADRLFAAEDPQLAIGQMTTELGLAFDTTLVALVFGLLAGIPIAAVHAKERTFFREFATSIMTLRKKSRKEIKRVSVQ